MSSFKWSPIASGSGSGGGANTALSNLASVAINTSLLPATTEIYNLGNASLSWGLLYIDSLLNSVSGNTLNMASDGGVDIGTAGGSNIQIGSSGGNGLSISSNQTLVLTCANTYSVQINAAGTYSSFNANNFDLNAGNGTGTGNIDARYFDMNGNGDTYTLELRFWDIPFNNTVGLKAPAAIASSFTLTLPSADTALAGRPLISDGAGHLSFSAGASGSFVTVDAKTVTVVGGIITAIV